MGFYRFDSSTEEAIIHYLNHLPGGSIGYVELLSKNTVLTSDKAYIVPLNKSDGISQQKRIQELQAVQRSKGLCCADFGTLYIFRNALVAYGCFARCVYISMNQ
jgi:hypothetical protein